MGGPSDHDGTLIGQDDADRWLWARVLDDLLQLRELVHRAEEARPEAELLLQDLFAALFKARPVLREPRGRDERARHCLLAGLMESPDYRRLRLTTKLREFPAAVAAADLFPKLLAAWPEDTADEIDELARRDDLAALLRQFVRQATEKVDEVQELLEAWGTEPGQVEKLSLREAVALAEHVQQSAMLQEIAKLAGRMKRLTLSKHAVRVRHGADELVSIEAGTALERVLPHELASLRHPVLRREFFRRFAEGTLLQYELVGKETLGRGPMIVCLDSSQSMAGPREVWAKAVALALLTLAHRERRDFALIHFGSAEECHVLSFERGCASPEVVLQAIAFAFHGGTDFETPLREALRLIDGSVYDKADVVFVTDGACEVSGEFLAEFAAAKRRRAFRMFSVLIDATGRVSANTLERISEEVCRLSDVAGDQAVIDGLFGA